MSDEQDLTRSICSNLLKVVEQLQAASSASSHSIRPAAAVTSELEHSASVLGRRHGLLPSVDLLASSSNPITRHRTRPSLGTEPGSTADLVERQACTGGSSSHHDPGPPLNMSSQSHSEQLRQLFRSKTKLSPFDRKGKRRKLSDIVEDNINFFVLQIRSKAQYQRLQRKRYFGLQVWVKSPSVCQQQEY